MSLKDTLQQAADALGLNPDTNESEEARKKRRARGASNSSASDSTTFIGQPFNDSSGGTGSDTTSLPHSLGHQADTSAASLHSPSDHAHGGADNSATGGSALATGQVGGEVAVDAASGHAGSPAGDAATASGFDGAGADAGSGAGGSDSGTSGDAGSSAGGDGGASGGDGGGG